MKVRTIGRTAIAFALVVPLLAFAQAAKDTKKDAKAAGGSGTNIAMVNGVAVPRARSDFLMQQQASRGAQDNENNRNMIRDELINREVVVQEAMKSPVAKSTEVQTQLDLARQEVLVGAFLRDWVRRNPVSEADVQKEYDRARSQSGDREYRSRHILVESEDQAKNLIAELKKGGKFDELARKNSKDSGSAERGGDLDWNVPAAYDKQFADALVKLEKGKLTDAPVRSRFGFHVIQLDDVRPIKFPALADVKPRIQQQLTQHKIEELIRGLRAKAKVE